MKESDSESSPSDVHKRPATHEEQEKEQKEKVSNSRRRRSEP